MKARFPGTPRFWLKEMTDHLNHQLNVDVDPTFSGKPRDFPSSLMSSELRGIITSTFSECGSDTLQAFYEEWVLTMPTEINRGMF
jgi:TMEM214, C-terminal, caspase 4 activator